MAKLNIRPWTEADIPSIVDYWFSKNDKELQEIGADKTKLGTREQYQQSLLDIYKTPVDKTKAFYMMWLVDNKVVGYAALKDIAQDTIGCMHLHIWDSQHHGKGYGAKLFCMSVIELYHLFKLDLIVCEPKAANSMPNQMLNKIGFKKWRTYFGVSSEIALPCEMNSYIINHETACLYFKDRIIVEGDFTC